MRDHAPSRPDVVAIRCGPRVADVRRARRALEPAGAGVARGRRQSRGSRRAPRPHRARDRRAAVRHQQDRGRHGPAELAACPGRARDDRRRRGRQRDDRRARPTARSHGRSPARSRSTSRCVDTGEEYERRLAAHRPTDPGHSGAASDIAVQMYTSGTTGLPKGVLTTQRNLAAAYLSADVWAFDSRSVSLTPLPMFHIGGIGWAYLGLVNGATTILVSEFDAVAGARPARARTRDQRRVRPHDPADAGRRSGRRRARLLEPAFDRLRRFADHHVRSQGGAADVPLSAVRRLRPDRDDGRRRPARPRGSRRRRPAPAPAAIRGRASALGRDAHRRPDQRARLRPQATSARCGCERRT